MNIEIFFSLAVVSYNMHSSCAQDAVCAAYEIQNISVCGNSSVWAENTPNVTITHQINPAPSPPFNMAYNLVLKNTTRLNLCAFQFIDGACNVLAGDCVCRNNYKANKTVFAQMVIMDMVTTKQSSTVRYNLAKSSINDAIIHTFTLTACSLNITNAHVRNVSSNPCGFDCTSQFVCSEGYHDPNTDSSQTYQCNAAGKWNPSPPECTKVVQETTTMASTAPPTVIATTRGTSSPDATDTNSTGSNTPAARIFHPNSGPALAAIGAILAAVCIGIFVYMAVAVIEILKKMIWITALILSICAWAIALGLCFGMSSNESAVIAGIVLASVAFAGMVLVGVFLALQITQSKRDGIKGKVEKAMNMD